MVKVITYGTYDLLHYGHIRLLERAKELGDYLIVGVTADDFDKTRGKINVQQTLIERVEAVRTLKIADEIIIEEYEGQKIDDIKRYDVDIFTVGSDWIGKFDYLNDYCKVIYLDRTQGVSSSELREQKRGISFGLVGDSQFLNKVSTECEMVNGIKIAGICTESLEIMSNSLKQLPLITNDYDDLLEQVDAVYIRSQPQEHYAQIKKALMLGKHVLCESPITLNQIESVELFEMAKQYNVILMEALKTAYATAYSRLLLLVKSGRIGSVVSVDVICTSIQKIDVNNPLDILRKWDTMYEWGPTALLPIFQLLGTDYNEKTIVARFQDEEQRHENFSKIDFIYPNAAASIKVGSGVKSEGELVISGTKGYVYVPAPWWKTDYFEIRYENPVDNKRYFYPLEGEGIRYELVAFVRAIENHKVHPNIEENITESITKIMEDFKSKRDVRVICS